MQKHDDNSAFAKGIALLQKPVLPLAGMVQFLYITGDFADFADLLAELPETIETGGIFYEHPANDLMPYLDQMQALVDIQNGHHGDKQMYRVFGENDEPLDGLNAAIALANQHILTKELERINSVLCGACDCRLCCIGPDAGMRQQYFEIPLSAGEENLFSCAQLDSAESRRSHPEDEPGLCIDGQPFYQHREARIIHWQHGPGLILPRGISCPKLAENGRCQIYEQRPTVCRRPQIFPYLLEQEQNNSIPTFRLRQTLLAVMDCPYVSRLQQDIASYAALCELEMVFRHNKA